VPQPGYPGGGNLAVAADPPYLKPALSLVETQVLGFSGSYRRRRLRVYRSARANSSARRAAAPIPPKTPHIVSPFFLRGIARPATPPPAGLSHDCCGDLDLSPAPIKMVVGRSNYLTDESVTGYLVRETVLPWPDLHCRMPLARLPGRPRQIATREPKLPSVPSGRLRPRPPVF
jgi:hypothetical protein